MARDLFLPAGAEGVGEPAEPVGFERSRDREFWSRFWRSRRAVVGSAIILLAIFVAVFAGVLSPYNPDAILLSFAKKAPLAVDPKGNLHLLGTDPLGRDILTRIFYGGRVSLSVGVLAVLIAGAIGVPLGLISGYRGGFADSLIMRLADVQLAIPGLLLAIALISVVGSSLLGVIGILGFTGWVGYARIVRGQVLSLKELAYVQAAQALGMSDTRILIRHVLSNVWTPIIVVATQQVGGVIIAESSLTFLGIGVPRTTPTWGTMIADGRGYLDTSPWIATAPGIVLTVVVLAVYFFGDGLRDVLDPKLKLF
jgi:peptide/nickel transport system permease protein